MKSYIIHLHGDITAQMHTCDRHALPPYIYAGYAPETCADDDCPWHGNRLAFFDPGFGLSETVESEIKAHQESLAAAGRNAFQKLWDDKYRAEYDRLCAEKSKTVAPPELTQADLELAHAQLRAVCAEDQVKELKALLVQASDELEKLCPILDASLALEKEASYLHPFSLEVSDVLSRFQAAVLQWKKTVDAPPAKA